MIRSPQVHRHTYTHGKIRIPNNYTSRTLIKIPQYRHLLHTLYENDFLLFFLPCVVDCGSEFTLGNDVGVDSSLLLGVSILEVGMLLA